MKVGMNLLLWTTHPTLNEHTGLLRDIKKWGFDGAEFPVLAMGEDDCRQLGGLCDDLGLARTAILAFGAEAGNPVSPEASSRRMALDTLRASIDKTRALGTDILVGPFQQALGSFTGKPPTDDEWQRSVAVIRTAAEHASTMHVELAVEPLNRFEMYLMNTADAASRFCRDVGLPNVGMLADTHHANIEEERPAEAWRAVKDHIYHVHISENHRGIPGSGHAVTPDIFKVLRLEDYDRWLVIEAFGDKVTELIAGLHIWRPFFEREEDVAVDGLRYIREQWQAAG